MSDLLASSSPYGALLVFVYGCLVGSFLNVVIYRLPQERSLVWPGSACSTCGTPLSWWQNLPVLSFLWLGGRCHTCGAGFSLRYALVELSAGLVSAALYFHHQGLGFPFFYHAVFFGFLFVIFFMDLDHWIILDEVSVPGVALGCLGAAWMPARVDELFSWLVTSVGYVEPGEGLWWNVGSSLLGCGLGALMFWGIQGIGTVMARQDALGGGDIKLAAMMGAFLGGGLGLVSFFLSFLLGSLVALPLMVWGRRRAKDPVPLGTFMAVAAVLTTFWGPQLLAAFLDWPRLLS